MNNNLDTSEQKRFRVARLARLTLFKILPSLGKWNLTLMVLTVLVGALLPVGLTLVTGALVGSVPGAVDQGLESPAGRLLIAALAAVSATFVIQQVIGPFQWAITSTISRLLDGKLRERLMRATLSPAGIAHLEDPELLDEVSKATGVGPGRDTPGGAVGGMLGVAGRYLQTFLFAIILGTFVWWMPLMLFAVLFYVRQLARSEYLRMIEVYSGQQEQLRRAQYFFGLDARPEAAKETRTFGLGGWIRDRFTHFWEPILDGVWEKRALSVRRFFPRALSLWLALALSYYLIVRSAVDGAIDPGQLTILLMAVSGVGAIGNISGQDSQVEFGMAAIPALLGIEKITSPAKLPHSSADPAGFPKQEIRLAGVGFHYPGSERPIFEGLDLVIPQGRSMALVGPNGAGKTTLIKLLCRLYDPTGGRILVDGTDLREFDPEKWQGRIAAIFQDFVKYEFSAADNIGLGAPEHMDLDEVKASARKAGASSIVEGLPKEWDSILSRRYTDGADLSGGEWQRIALARALHAAAARPGVLILDEPTANLDVRAEAEIYERFLDLTEGLTTILISHRFSTVRGVDRICVIEAGKVNESGSHDELIALGGRYAQMFRLQAARFLSE